MDGQSAIINRVSYPGICHMEHIMNICFGRYFLLSVDVKARLTVVSPRIIKSKAKVIVVVRRIEGETKVVLRSRK